MTVPPLTERLKDAAAHAGAKYLTALLLETADALEQAERALRTITSCESGIWGGACPSCQRAARAALAALAGRDKQEDG